MSHVGNNIRIFREEKNMSREELALKIRCGTKIIENYENGITSPNLETIMKLSTALDIPASEIVNKHAGN